MTELNLNSQNSNLPATSISGRIEELTKRLDATIAIPRRQDNFVPPQNGFAARAQRKPSRILGYWRMLHRRRATLAAMAFVGALGGVLFALAQTPVFRATTSIEVLDMNADGIALKDGTATTTSGTNLETQVDILKSDTLRKRAIHKIASSGGEIDQPEDRTQKLRELLNLPQSPELSREDILARTADGMSVSASSASRIILIGVDSPNPELAADYANTLAAEFIQERLESHWDATQHTTEWLTHQLGELKAKLAVSEDQLQSYATAANLQFTGEQGGASVSQEKMSQLQKELSSAQADRIAKQSRYELASKAAPDTLPESLDDPQLRANREKLAEAKRDLADALATYIYAGTPKVQKLQSDVTGLEAEIAGARQKALDRIHNDLVVAQTREKLLAQALAAQGGAVSSDESKAVRYNILKREVDANREVYETLLQRVKEEGIAAAMRAGNFRVVDPAVPPSTPVNAAVGRAATAGMLLGLVAGIGCVFFRKNSDESVSVPGETPFYLGAPELAVVPAAEPAPRRKKSRAAPQRLLSIGREDDGIRPMVERTAFQQADSPLAESFRVALTSLLFASRQSGAPRAIVVSSPGPGEGKTTVACNLAISYAEINWRVLLIDGDLRRPRLHTIFGVSEETGLATLLSGSDALTPASLISTVQTTNIPNLSVMTRGRLRNTVVNLLHSPRLAEVLRLARAQFDVVIIDTPSLLSLPDARAIGHLTDGVVMVVRSRKTFPESVIAARERLRQNDIRVLGSILNDWNPRKIRDFGSDDYVDHQTFNAKEFSGIV